MANRWQFIAGLVIWVLGLAAPLTCVLAQNPPPAPPNPVAPAAPPPQLPNILDARAALEAQLKAQLEATRPADIEDLAKLKVLQERMRAQAQSELEARAIERRAQQRAIQAQVAPPPAAVAPPADVVGPLIVQDMLANRPAIAQEDRQQFLARVSAYNACALHWFQTEEGLSSPEHKAILQNAMPRLDSPADEQLLQSILNDTSRQLPPWFPGLLVLQHPAETVSTPERLLKNVDPRLAQEMVRPLDRACGVHQSFQHDAFLDYAVALLDAELFLSQQQREILRTEIGKSAHFTGHPFYSFSPSTNYLPYQPLVGLVTVTAVKEKLSPAQQQRLSTQNTAANVNRASSILRFSSRDTREAWEAQIDTYVQQLRAETLQVFDLRLDFCAREGQLSEQQLNQLRVAAKGVAVQYSDERRESIRSQLDQLEPQIRQQPGTSTFGFGTSTVTPATLLSRPLWTTAWQAVMSSAEKNVDAERQNFNRAARDRAVLALLDQELWLRPEQRDQLLPLVSSVLPPVDSLTASREQMRDVIWLAHVLSLLEPEQLTPILDAPQLAAWQLMQKSFPQLANNAYRVAGVRLRSGGQSSIPLMNPDGSRRLPKGQQAPQPMPVPSAAAPPAAAAPLLLEDLGGRRIR